MAGDPTVANAEKDGLYDKGRTSKVTIPEVATKTASFTLKNEDSSCVFKIDSATNVSITLPNHMPVGYQVAFIQMNTGAVTFSLQSGATLNNRQSFVKSAGLYSMVTVMVITNADGLSAKYLLVGDGAV